MSLVLTWGARMPTIRIGRMAGQFSKPRSSPTEVVDGKEVFSFRGDNVNSFDPSDRDPDPERLVHGYFHSAATLNYARSLLSSHFADLHEARHWDLGFVEDTEHREAYQRMVDEILSSLDFMRVVGVGDTDSSIRTANIFSSHEGLHLAYEEAVTRPALVQRDGQVAADVWHSEAEADAKGDAKGDGDRAEVAEGGKLQYFNLGAHFLWIGDRTRQLDHAHVEYFRGIANPIGIKVGPSMDPKELVPLIRALWPNPSETPGKIVLITRLGAGRVEELLPPLIHSVQDAGLKVVWTCDPMHGNTRKADDAGGLKTREFDDIITELQKTFGVHRRLDSWLGGVHFELTGENVTECTGGPQQLQEADLPRRYTTYCDPRLNYGQSMELAFRIAQHLREQREGHASASKHPSMSPSLMLEGGNGEKRDREQPTATDAEEPAAKRRKAN